MGKPVPYQIPRFGSLDLTKEPEEVGAGGAIDMLNCDLDRTGALRARDGYLTHSSSAAAKPYYSAWANGSNIIAGRGDGSGNTFMDRILSAGTVLGSFDTGTTNLRFGFANFGTPTTSRTYFGSNTTTVARWDAGTFSSPAAMPKGDCLTVQQPDNRLVVAGDNAQTSRVYFSGAGAAETFGANDYVDLRPGDGERISALVSWRGQVFAFKQSAFWTFYGNGTDTAGNPVFNFRAVEGKGTAWYGGQTPAVATPHGVFFYSDDGIYLTTGAAPRRVSGPLDSLFQVEVKTPFFTGSMSNSTVNSLCWYKDRLYFSSGGTPGLVLVYDPVTEDWLYWTFADVPTAMTVVNAANASSFSSTGEVLFFGSESNRVMRFTGDSSHVYTTDNGTAIPSRYRSGFYSPIGSPSQECTILASIIEGIGTPSFSVSRDFGAVPTSGGGAKTAVTLGTSPAYAQGRHRVSQRGRRFSWQVEATSGAWRINSITQHVAGIRSPGLKTT